MKSIGQQLREARAARKMTLEAASKATKIKVEQLIELENNNYSRFAAPAYARGFIRIYARMLGLDEHRLIDQLDGFIHEQDEEIFLNSNPVNYIPDDTHDKQTRLTPREVGMMIAGGIMLCIIGILLYKVFWVDAGMHTSTAAQPPTQPTAPVPAPPATPSADPIVPAIPVNPWAVSNDASAPQPPEGAEDIPRAVPLNETTQDKTPQLSEQAVPVALPVLPISELGREPITAPRAQPVEPGRVAADEIRPAVPVGATAPTQLPTPPTVRKAEKLKQLVLETEEDCWVRVTEITEGKSAEVFSGLMSPREKRQFQAERFVLMISVPAAVKVFLDGVELGVLSEERSPMEFQIPKPQ